MKSFFATCTLAAVSLLSVSAFAQDPSASPSYGEVSLSAGFMPDPHSVSVTAGGSADASSLGAGCVGSIASAPDFRLVWGGGPATIKFTADGDTTLVINGADGSWLCADDVDGVNPAVVIDGAGTYDIFVGSYGGAMIPGTLEITEY
jgi:hypothetical protein